MRRSSYAIPLILGLVGCQWYSTARHPEPGNLPPPAATTTYPTGRGIVPITPANASIEFTGSTPLRSQVGSFARFDGTLEMPTDDPKDFKIRVVVDMDSTTTQIGLLTRHLKGDGFFDVARHPKSEFVSETIAPTGEAGAYRVAGTLAFHGERKAIAFPARIAATPDEVTLEATLAIRQTEFGMAEAASKTTDEVPVRISLRHRRK